MAAKKKPATPAENLQRASTDATDVVESVLKLASVIEQLAHVPKPAIEWAMGLRESGGFGSRIPNPADRIGQRGLERRLAGLREGISKVYPDGESCRADLLLQIDRLERAVAAAGVLPLLKRRAAHSRIDDELDLLEKALVDAILSGGSDPLA